MNKKGMKSLLAALALVLLLGVVSACGNGKNESSAPGTESGSNSKSPIKLMFVGQGYSNLVSLPGYEDRTQNVGDYLRLIADEYTKLNPHVSIDILALNSADGTTQQLDVEIASGNVPNVLFDFEARAAKYKGKDLIMTLDPYITEEERKDFISGSLQDKDVWRLPIYFTPKVMSINKTLFEKAGHADLLPKPDNRKWTTEQFVKALEAVNSPPSVYATILFAKTQSAQESIMGYFWPFGAQMFNVPDFSKVALNSEAGLAAMKFYKGLLDSKLTVPAPAALTDDDMWAMFEKQQLAVAPEVPVFESIGKDNGFEVYYVAYPHPEGQTKTPFGVFTDSVSVFKNKDEEVQDESVKFAKYVASEWGPIMATKRNAFPLRESHLQKVEMSDEQKAIYEVVKAEGIMNIGQELSQYSEIREAFKNMDQMVFMNNKTPEEGLKWFEDEVNKLLAK